MRSTPLTLAGRRLATRILALPAIGTALAFAGAAPLAERTPPQAAGPYAEKVEGTMITLEMMPVPAGTVQSASSRARVPAFWIMKTEVSWDAYDVYVFGLDRPRPGGPADAAARPSKPYVLPGDQFGHSGHPALGMTFQAAEQFAAWISSRTGRKYRLPTEAEWERACQAGASKPASPEAAWFRDNAGARTHKVATRTPDGIGLHDLLGNAGEWVLGADGPVVKGGAWNSPGEEVSCAARRKQTPAWNATDPNLPKSSWWLSDAPFVGFRLIREP
jgi:formylglycine-generating enzyme required for sulfatase activity